MPPQSYATRTSRESRDGKTTKRDSRQTSTKTTTLTHRHTHTSKHTTEHNNNNNKEIMHNVNTLVILSQL